MAKAKMGSFNPAAFPSDYGAFAGENLMHRTFAAYLIAMLFVTLLAGSQELEAHKDSLSEMG